MANKCHDSCSQKAHGISLPKWANQSVFEKLGHLAAEQYRLQASTPEMRRLRAGEVWICTCFEFVIKSDDQWSVKELLSEVFSMSPSSTANIFLSIFGLYMCFTDWVGMVMYGGKMMGILGEGCWGRSCQERGNGEGQKGGLWMWWKRTWLRLKWRRRIQKTGTTGDGKSAVATPDGKSRTKKKTRVSQTNDSYILQATKFKDIQVHFKD